MASGQDSSRLASGSGTTTPRSFDSSCSVQGRRSTDEGTSLLGIAAVESDFVGVDYGATGKASNQSAGNLASLPTRLARSASMARKVERRQKRSAHLKTFRTRMLYYVPVLDWLPAYTFRAFVGDVTSAFTMTSLIVPQAMSYASNLSHVQPVNGLFGAAIPPMIYAMLGTCRQLSVGPEAALSLIMGEAINKFLAEEVHAHGTLSNAEKMKISLTIATVITLEAGIITFVLGILRLGFLDAVLSRALLRGFITAVGIVIFVAQLIPILGLERMLASSSAPVDTVLEKVSFIISNLGHVHKLTLAVSLGALAILVLAKMFKARLVKRRGFKWLAYVPEVLAVVIASTVLTCVFDWDEQGLQVLGKVSAGQASFAVPFRGAGVYLTKCLGTSTVIAILGFLDSIVGAKDCSQRFHYPISPNRELVALGAANVAASFVSGTLPGYGSITRSRLAGDTGATTQMTSLLTGGFVLFVTFFLLGFLFYLPKCILAVIICVVVFSILAEFPHDVKFFWKMRAWVDGGLLALTFLLTLFVNVEVGITVSIMISVALCIRESAAMRIRILGRVPGTAFFEPLDDDEGDDPSEEIPGVLIVRLRDVSLTFANAGAMKERLRRLERYGKGRHHPSDRPRRAEASVVIFHLADVEDIDASALQLILEVVESYVARHVLVYWTHLQPQARARLAKAGVLSSSGDETHVQATVQAALNALNDTMVSVNPF